MVPLRTLALRLAGGAAVCAVVVALPPTRRAVFCSGIVNPWDTVGLYVVTVPEPEHHRYNDDFIRFATEQGLHPAPSSYRVPEVDDGPWFLMRNVTACGGTAFAWSSNVARANEFVVTFHANQLFGRRAAERTRDAFLERFRRRYKIAREISWDRRVPVRRK